MSEHPMADMAASLARIADALEGKQKWPTTPEHDALERLAHMMKACNFTIQTCDHFDICVCWQSGTSAGLAQGWYVMAYETANRYDTLAEAIAAFAELTDH